MCLGDILGTCLAPCAGCCKYGGTAAGVGLVFTFGLIGLDLKADWPIILILLACIVAFVWFLLVYCCFGLIDKDEEEYNYLTRYFSPLCDPKILGAGTQSFEMISERRSWANELAATCQQIDTALMRLFINMMWHALAIVILFLIIAIWFVDPKGPFILGILFGSIAITLILMMVIKIASRSLGRILIQATEFKEETFILMFSCGYGVIMLAVALSYFFFVICFLLFKQGVVHGLPDTHDQATVQALGIGCTGYALGFIVPAFIYRETVSILARGIFNSIDSLVKTDTNLSFNNPYIGHPTKLAYIIQSILSNQIVNMMDATICIVVLTVSAFVLFANSSEVVTQEHYATLLAPTLYLSMNVLCQVLVQLFKTWFDDGDASTFTMYNCRSMVILANIVSFCVFYFMPMATMMAEFSLMGTSSPESIQNAALTINKVKWSCILGQLCNLVLIIYLEWLTSHGCGPVRNQSVSSVERVPMQNVFYAEYLSGFGGFIALLLFALLVICVYSICGWIGFMAAASGFICNLIIYIPILYVGAMASDGYKLCCMGQVNSIVSDRLYKIAWAARTYAIYARLTSAGGSLLLSFGLLGCAIFYFQKEDADIFLKGVGLFGILVGVAITLFYRGWNIGAVISISKKYNMDLYKSGIVVEVAQDDTINDFIRDKLWVALQYIYGMFISNTIIVFFIGFFFGFQAIIGILIGIILITMLFMFQSLVSGTTLKNARHYNESNDTISKKDKNYGFYVQGDALGSVLQESSSIPLIIFMLYNVLLIIACNGFFNTVGDIYAPPTAPATL